jgi:hypothetical protein
VKSELEEYMAMSAMSRVMRAGLRVALATTALGISPVLAQNAEKVKPPGAASSFDFGGATVFEHAIRMPKEKAWSLFA